MQLAQAVSTFNLFIMVYCIQHPRDISNCKKSYVFFSIISKLIKKLSWGYKLKEMHKRIFEKKKTNFFSNSK